MEKIALFFTILCAVTLNGMNSKSQQLGHYGLGRGHVPSEIQSIIEVYKNLEDVIETIRIASNADGELRRMVNDDYEFTKLAHILADEFNVSTYIIAKKFATPLAGQYVTLGDALINFVQKKDSNAITQLIIQGADVNYIANSYLTPLIVAITAEADAVIIRLLLDVGADPKVKVSIGYTVLDYFNIVYLQHSQEAEIREILQNAMNSNSQ